jgi:hypothetical protein
MHRPSGDGVAQFCLVLCNLGARMDMLGWTTDIFIRWAIGDDETDA